MNTIESFNGPHRFLSNFYPSPLAYTTIVYPTVEHAFQAMKTLNHTERQAIAQADSPGYAKRLGRGVSLRPDWEQIKDEVMYRLVLKKFTDHGDLRGKLFLTMQDQLVEGNTWNDTYWGVCNGHGRNQLGITLMRVRDELAARHGW